MREYLFDSNLLSEVLVVDRSGMLGGRCLDRSGSWFYVRVGCGDHFRLRANCPFVARGHFHFWGCCVGLARNGLNNHGYGSPAWLGEFFIERLVGLPDGKYLMQ